MLKAATAADQVIAWARSHGNEPITRDAIDKILSRDRSEWWGGANVRTVRACVRSLANLPTDCVILTDREEVQYHRCRFNQMRPEELRALHEQIADDPDDPRGRDGNLIHALYAALKGQGPDTRSDEEIAMDAMQAEQMSVPELKDAFVQTMNYLAENPLSTSAADLAGRLWRAMTEQGVRLT